jgi:hypothetical protein
VGGLECGEWFAYQVAIVLVVGVLGSACAQTGRQPRKGELNCVGQPKPAQDPQQAEVDVITPSC